MSDVTSIMLARYLADECAPHEREEIRRWIEADPARREMVASLESMWLQGRTRRATLDVDAFWTAIAARLDREEPAAPARRRTPTGPILERLPPMPQPRRWYLAAAAAAAVAAAVLLVAIPSARKAMETIATDGRSSAIREMTTKRGQRAEVSLADGTRVLLGPESRLRFTDDFGARIREVDLQGQAHFIVTHDERKPFRVRTASSVSEDLGTEFVVRQYPAEAAVWVAVASGRVALAARKDAHAVASAMQPLILGAGAVGRVDSAGRVVGEPDASVDEYFAWTRGELVFDDASLNDVTIELARWYDLDFRIADPLLRRKRVTLTLGAESAPAALEAVAVLAGARYQQQGRVVTFVPTPSLRETSR